MSKDSFFSNDFLVNNMKTAGLYEYFYDFSVDYNAIAVDDILDIYKCNAMKCVYMNNQCSLV